MGAFVNVVCASWGPRVSHRARSVCRFLPGHQRQCYGVWMSTEPWVELTTKDLREETRPTVLVSVPRPIGAAFEETPSGIVYVAEVLSGSNAEKCGKIIPGWEVIGVSYPYGDAVAPVAGKGLAIFQSFVQERDQSEDEVQLELREFPGGVEVLQRELEEFEYWQDDKAVKRFNEFLARTPYPHPEDEAGEEDEELSEVEKKLRRMTVEEKMEFFKEHYQDPELEDQRI